MTVTVLFFDMIYQQIPLHLISPFSLWSFPFASTIQWTLINQSFALSSFLLAICPAYPYFCFKPITGIINSLCLYILSILAKYFSLFLFLIIKCFPVNYYVILFYFHGSSLMISFVWNTCILSALHFLLWTSICHKIDSEGIGANISRDQFEQAVIFIRWIAHK